MSHACPCVDYLFPDSPFFWVEKRRFRSLKKNSVAAWKNQEKFSG